MIHRRLACVILVSIMLPCGVAIAQDDAPKNAKKARQADQTKHAATRQPRAQLANPDPVTTPKVGPGLWVASTGHSLVRPSVTGLEQVKIEEEALREGDEKPPARYEVLATMRLSTFVPVGEIQPVGESEATAPVSEGAAAYSPEVADAS